MAAMWIFGGMWPLFIGTVCFGFVVPGRWDGMHHRDHTCRSTERSVEDRLSFISQSLKLEVFDLDEGVYGLESKVSTHGIEVVKAEISTVPSLGLELSEMASSGDGRGLVLVSGASGNAAAAGVQCGDALTLVRSGDVVRRLTALDYDATLAGIKECIAAQGDTVTLELNRLVERAPITVNYEYTEAGARNTGTVTALAGENLRKLFLRSNLKLYAPKTKRFDQPFATGDCAGEGICGTSVRHPSERASERRSLFFFDSSLFFWLP